MIHDLWDQLTDFTPCALDQALVHLFNSVGHLMQADNVFWAATVRVVDGSRAGFDHEHGWRVHASEAWRPHLAPNMPGRVASSRRAVGPEIPTGLITADVTRDSGRFRVHRLHDGADRPSTPTAVNGHGGHAPHLSDRLWVIFPVTADAESYFVFDRAASGPRFSASDTALAAYALRGIKWFHRQLLLGHGLVAALRPLTASERRIARLLLTEQTEKEIAQALGLGFDTTHKCVGEIYRKFGVRSRTGLMALWLGGRGSFEGGARVVATT